MEKYYRVTTRALNEPEEIAALALREIEAFAFARSYNAISEHRQAALFELDLAALAAVPGQPVSLAMRRANSIDRSA